MLALVAQLYILGAAKKADWLPGAIFEQQSPLPLLLAILQLAGVRERVPAVGRSRRIPAFECAQRKGHLESFQIAFFQLEKRVPDRMVCDFCHRLTEERTRPPPVLLGDSWKPSVTH